MGRGRQIRWALVIVVSVLLFALLLCGSAAAAQPKVEGVCPGYRLAVEKPHTLVITNGPRTAFATGTCKTAARWDVLRVVGMCQGQSFTANADKLGNLTVGCKK